MGTNGESGEEWERIAQTPSVQLFADRARNELPSFAVTPGNASDVAQICRYLEGVPLALELAAAWIPVLEPAQLLQRLQDRFALLVNQQESAPSRHGSLYATIEWSYEQLAPLLQRLFARLSVFHNGWTLEGAEAVGEEPQTLTYLPQLLRHALILREGGGSGTGNGRFRMLETLRDFARSRLDAGEIEALQQRHAAYYLQLAECASGRLTGAEQSHWLERLQEENDNLRAALDGCVQAASRAAHTAGSKDNQTNLPDAPAANHQSPTAIEMGLRFVTALWRFWEVRAYFEEAEQWIETILALSSQADPALRAQALESAGNLDLNARNLARGKERLEESIRLYEALGKTRGVGSALYVLAATLRDQGDLSAAKNPV